MTKAEIFCMLNGIHLHENIIVPGSGGSVRYACSICGSLDYNPTFSDIRSICEVMDKRPDGKLFYAKLMYMGNNVEAIDDDGYIDRRHIHHPEELLDDAIKFCFCVDESGIISEDVWNSIEWIERNKS